MRPRIMQPTRFHARVLFAALAAATVGCDSSERPQAGEVEGTWALVEDSAGAVILDVQGSEVDVFTENTIGGCFARIDYTIIRRNGIDFRLTNGPDTLTIEMQRDGDVLRVTAFDQQAEYALTAFDPASLTVCHPPEPTADCALLPTLSPGSEIADSLDESDDRTYLGTRFQLYALDFETPLELVVAMSSPDVDSYLSLHDSTGAFIEANDDRSSLSPDAELELTLGAGCHILMATTARADELGEFELTVTPPSAESSPGRTP